MLSESVYGRVWHAARRAALGPDLAATALARRPYDLDAIRSHADDLWRSGHPAAAATMEATAAAIRDTDKALAKRLRRSAHRARTRR